MKVTQSISKKALQETRLAISGRHLSKEVKRAFIENEENEMEKFKGKEDEAVYFSDGSEFVRNTKVGYSWIRKNKRMATI